MPGTGGPATRPPGPLRSLSDNYNPYKTLLHHGSKSYGTMPGDSAADSTVPIRTSEGAKQQDHDEVDTPSSDEGEVRPKPAPIQPKPNEDGILSHRNFCKLIGMDPTAPSFADDTDLESGRGLYHDIRTSYQSASNWHYWFEVAVYGALLLQVLLAACFIVLGAMRGDYHISIAVLGAFSACLAGCLALVKGQGLPMRFRRVRPILRDMDRALADKYEQERDSLWEVQLEAEELHWHVAAGKVVRFIDVERIWSRYLQVKRDACLNHPDVWNQSPAGEPAPDGQKCASGSAQQLSKPGPMTSTVYSQSTPGGPSFVGGIAAASYV